MIEYLHLLSRAFPTGLFSSELEGTVVKSSKLIIIRLMSSTSLRIGAITSEHRNFEPASNTKIINQKPFGFIAFSFAHFPIIRKTAALLFSRLISFLYVTVLLLIAPKIVIATKLLHLNR